MAEPRRPTAKPSVPPPPRQFAAPIVEASSLSTPPAAPFQFSVRMLLATVTIVAIGSALAAYVGPGVAWPIVAMLLGVVALSAPLCLGTLALYCRGYRQTFFLGAFVGSLPLVRQIGGGSYLSWLGLALAIAANLVSAVCCGWLALATRRFAERRGWHHTPGGKNNGLGD